MFIHNRHFDVTLLRRFLETDIQEVIIFSRDEKKQDEMRTLYRNDKMKFIIGDIR
ncbi:polysaccharide biosynthesis protein, partial [Escherichia coli]|nr:polysaccharide biosynthesis protein [Escherichia coli]